MTEGITFYNLKDVNEFIEDKRKNGIESYYVKKGNQYIVYILGNISNKHPNIREVNKSEFYDKTNVAEAYPSGRFTDEPEILVSPKTTTHQKVHEMGHVILDHSIDKPTDKEAAKEEIEAEIYAYKKMNKNIDYKVALPALRRLDQDYNTNKKRIIFIIKDVLKEKGIDLPHNIEEYWITRIQEK